jgi:hypothetical protein
MYSTILKGYREALDRAGIAIDMTRTTFAIFCNVQHDP